MTTYEKKRAKCQRLASFARPTANAARVAKNTLVLYLRMFAVMAIGLYTGRVTLQALGVSDYGLKGIAGGVVGMIVFLNGSLSTASSRFLTVEMGKGTLGSLKRAFSTIFFVQVAVALLFTILLETVGLVFLETKLNIDASRIFAVKWMYHCSVITTFLSITQVPYSAILIAHERMSAFAYMAIYDVVVKLGIALALLWYQGDKLILLANMWLINSVVVLLIYRIYCMRNFTEARFRWTFDRKLIKPVFSFAGWHVATQTIIMLLSQGVLMLNQRYFGPTLIAAISIGQVLNSHIQGFIGNFKTAANPQIIKLYAAKKYDESKRMLIDTVHFSVYLLLLLGVPAFSYAEEALRIWLGANMPEMSPVIARITFAGAFFTLFDVSLYVILYAEGRIKENMWLNTIGGVIVFGLIFYQIKWLRNPLASVATLAAYQVVLGMINKPILLHFIAKYTFKDMLGIFIPPFKALALCAIVGWSIKALMPSSLWWAIPSCALMALLNMTVIFMFVATAVQRQMCFRLLSRVPCAGAFFAKLNEK